MADLGLLRQKINGLPVELRATVLDIVTILCKDLRFGHPQQMQPDPLTNFGGGFFTFTTPSTPGDEVAVAHGFGRIPYLLVPCLPLDTVGASLVPLTVTQAATAKNLYLSSSVADAEVTVIVEG